MIVAFVPDRFAHYRYHLVSRISGIDDISNFFVCFDKKPSEGIPVASMPDSCSPVEIRDIFIGKYCIWQVGLFSFLHKQRPNVVIFWADVTRISTWISALYLKFFLKRRVVFWGHGFYGRESLILFLTRKFFFRIADVFFTYGNYSRSIFINKNVLPSSRVVAIYNSLPRPSSNLVYPLPNLTNEFGLFYIGRLIRSKDLPTLFKALSKLIEDSCYFFLKIIGDGPEKSNLIALAESLGIKDRIIFYPANNETKEIASIIRDCSVCVSPGNVGLLAIHSMSLGKPVITHANKTLQMPEFESIISNKNGLFFEYQNPESLAGSIIQIRHLINSGNIRAEFISSSFPEFTVENQIQIFKSSLGM